MHTHTRHFPTGWQATEECQYSISLPCRYKRIFATYSD